VLKGSYVEMIYRPPISRILLAMQSAGKLGASTDAAFSLADAETILTEAGRFASDRIAPLNRVGDLHPAQLVDGSVMTPPGWKLAYQEWCDGGWNGLTGPAEFDGQGLPLVLAAACTELWNAASIAFALCPLLTAGAIEAIAAHASDDLKKRYLPKLVSGEWCGTMNLTEPQSGSDLSQLRCKAKRHGDGSYRISGTKIFITYGEHDFTANIIHLVLARLDDAPPGTKGISLFIVPKILPDGSPNDVRCQALEQKLGIHGSPTCTMIFGNQGGATGWLVGDENRGLACMFTMMNNARLLVGVQGVALAERASQAALAFARDRRQGRTKAGKNAVAIIEHPDVKRMLLDMRVKTAAARALCMATAAALDAGTGSASVDEKKSAQAVASLLTPLAKSYATDIALEVTSTAIQVHGGMGYMEQTGVAQYYRDARILPIYEGTNGIQAIDLVTRKIGLDEGRILAELLQFCETALARFINKESAQKLVNDVRHMSKLHVNAPGGDASLSIASAFLRALAATVSAGCLADMAICARGGALQEEAETDARYYIATELPSAVAAAKAAVAGAPVLIAASLNEDI
jgi:acyl-CoA dehydrogenase